MPLLLARRWLREQDGSTRPTRARSSCGSKAIGEVLSPSDRTRCSRELLPSGSADAHGVPAPSSTLGLRLPEAGPRPCVDARTGGALPRRPARAADDAAVVGDWWKTRAIVASAPTTVSAHEVAARHGRGAELEARDLGRARLGRLLRCAVRRRGTGLQQEEGHEDEGSSHHGETFATAGGQLNPSRRCTFRACATPR